MIVRAFLTNGECHHIEIGKSLDKDCMALCGKRIFIGEVFAYMPTSSIEIVKICQECQTKFEETNNG